MVQIERRTTRSVHERRTLWSHVHWRARRGDPRHRARQLLGFTKIRDEYLGEDGAALLNHGQDVSGFDVAVDEVARREVLKRREQAQQRHRLRHQR